MNETQGLTLDEQKELLNIADTATMPEHLKLAWQRLYSKLFPPPKPRSPGEHVARKVLTILGTIEYWRLSLGGVVIVTCGSQREADKLRELCIPGMASILEGEIAAAENRGYERGRAMKQELESLAGAPSADPAKSPEEEDPLMETARTWWMGIYNEVPDEDRLMDIADLIRQQRDEMREAAEKVARENGYGLGIARLIRALK